MVLNILQAGWHVCRARSLLGSKVLTGLTCSCQALHLTFWFPFQSTQSLTKPAPELSGTSCVGSVVNTIRLNAPALGRKKWWVTPSLAAGTRRMSVTPA